MFNFKKHSQSNVTDAITDAIKEEETSIDNPSEAPIDSNAVQGNINDPDQEALYNQLKDAEIMRQLELLASDPAQADMANRIMIRLKADQRMKLNPTKYDASGRASLKNQAEEMGVGYLVDMALKDQAVIDAQRQIRDEIARLNRYDAQGAGMAQAGQDNTTKQGPVMMATFNLKKYKKAQFLKQSRFPVLNEADFIEKFIDDLLAYNNEPGSQNYEQARMAFEEIEKAVSPGFEEEVNSILESIIQLDPITERDKATKYLMKIYEVLLPDNLKEKTEKEIEQTESVHMNGKTPEGIVKFNLSDHILNNRSMIKTAADQFGQQYLLYGPTEKRICPKLRGKNLSVGDVVSEYICRHHCIDGLVIDDNKTICGEALWRANAMDKFSREYVDAEGNIKGGYINKRFEINRNVDEENRMRLKPGETRKPRPASLGNYESRLQDMRAKEGKSRGYGPNVNTGNAFEWCHDPDQNNVGVTQSERDRREESMGHQLVQYTNKEDFANNPQKIAFNFKKYKTSYKNTCETCGKKFEGIDYECSKCKRNHNKTKSAELPQPRIQSGFSTERGVLRDPKRRNPKEHKYDYHLTTMNTKTMPKSENDMITTLKEKAKHMKDKELIEAWKKNSNERLKDIFIKEWQQRQMAHSIASNKFNMKHFKKAKEKGVTYKGEHFEYNPWAVCFHPEMNVTLPDGTSVPIKDINVGDEVISHLGVPRKVKNVFNRRIDGNLLEIKISGVSEPILTTEEHPFLGMRSIREFKGYAKNKNGIKTGKKWYSDQYSEKLSFIEARNLKKGDAIHSPSIEFNYKDLHFNIDEEDAFALGLYCAEGSLDNSPIRKSWKCGNRHNRVQNFEPNDDSYRTLFTLNADGDAAAINFLKKYAVEKFGKNSYSVYGPYPLNPKTITLIIRSQKFYNMCLNNVGKYSQKKRLSCNLLSSSVSILQNFLAGYFVGDANIHYSSLNLKNGKYSSFKTKGQIKIYATSASKDLINQLFWACEKCGVVATTRLQKQNGGPQNREKTYLGYGLELNAQQSAKFAHILNRFNIFDEQILLQSKYRQGQRFARAACTFGKVISIERIPYNGTVYNLEVDEDNTYIVNFCSVHNCNKSTGGKKKDPEKFERCVQHIKDQSRNKGTKSKTPKKKS